MMIEIRKAEFLNKGAELMLYSILDKLQNRYPEAKFAMAPNLLSQPYEKRVKLGFYQKAYYWKFRIQWGLLANLIPQHIRKMYGIVIDKDIDVVIDAAGFSYSDQWGTGSCYELANSSKRWKKNNIKIILLPQAFGPFKSNNIKYFISTAIANTDLVFARDKDSYNYLIDSTNNKEKIKLSPDFTNLMDGIVPDNFDKINNRFCIIPNYRMIDKVNEEDKKAYLPFLIKCTKYLLDKKQKPFILIHEGVNDMNLAQEINKAVGGNLSIIKETDALKIKGIIGVCEGTLGSRFHGLVSALSQGVPSLATGWSHKYQMLFDDYNFEDGLLKVTTQDLDIYRKLDLIINEESKIKIRKMLLNRSIELKEQSNQMWEDVFKVIENKK